MGFHLCRQQAADSTLMKEVARKAATALIQRTRTTPSHGEWWMLESLRMLLTFSVLA